MVYYDKDGIIIRDLQQSDTQIIIIKFRFSSFVGVHLIIRCQRTDEIYHSIFKKAETLMIRGSVMDDSRKSLSSVRNKSA